MPWIEDRGDHLLLNIRVVPRASKDGVQGLMGDALKVRLQAPPVEGKANQRLVRFLAEHWNIPRASIEIVSGETGRGKRLRIHGPSPELKKELLSIRPE